MYEKESFHFFITFRIGFENVIKTVLKVVFFSNQNCIMIKLPRVVKKSKTWVAVGRPAESSATTRKWRGPKRRPSAAAPSLTTRRRSRPVSRSRCSTCATTAAPATTSTGPSTVPARPLRPVPTAPPPSTVSASTSKKIRPSFPTDKLWFLSMVRVSFHNRNFHSKFFFSLTPLAAKLFYSRRLRF